jgi:hypothetical protein
VFGFIESGKCPALFDLPPPTLLLLLYNVSGAKLVAKCHKKITGRESQVNEAKIATMRLSILAAAFIWLSSAWGT